MTSFLIEALLSNCPDYASLFKSLSWESESPQTGRVEALTSFIEGLGSLFSNSDGKSKNDNIAVHVENVIWSQCVPLLSKISSEECKVNVTLVCKLVKACLPLCGAATPGKVIDYALPFLQQSDELDLASGQFSVEVSSEVVAVLLPTIAPQEELVSRVALRLLSALLDCAGSEIIPKIILDDICVWHHKERTPTVTGRALMCLAALADPILTPHSLSSDPPLPAQFWRMVQDGLTHRDNLARKRALYLLKKCVALFQDSCLGCQASKKDEEILFMWDSNHRQVLREFWEDYALVMETLEENQIHVVRPVLNRIDTLIQIVNDTQDRSFVHPSWLLCVYQRMFHSENKALMKEGVCHLLQLQALQKTEFAMAFSQFIIGPFLDVLSEASLFHRGVEQSVGECPELGSKLQAFMVNFLPTCHPNIRLLCCFSLFCIYLQSSGVLPLLDVNGLVALREVLRCTMITHQVLLRGAAQCFLLNSAICLTDVSAVTIDDVFALLMHFRSNESLCRGTKLWHQFKPINDKAQEKESMKVYVQNELYNYLKVPASTGQAERLPDVSEAVKLARAILLCVDMEMCQPAEDVNSTLESVLSPLWDTLSRVSTNIYLPLRKSDKSLQLMLQLLLQGGINLHNENDYVLVALKNQILKVLDPILEFILRQLSGQLQELFDIERADMYVCVLKQLVIICRSVPLLHSKIQQTYLSKLINVSLKMLAKPSQQNPSVSDQVSRVVAMASLALICNLVEHNMIDMQSVSGLKMLNEYFYNPILLSPSSVGHFNETLMKPPALDSPNDTDGYSPVWQDWGRVVAHYLSNQWVCLSILSKTIGTSETEESRSSEILRLSVTCAIEGLSLLPSNLVLPIFTFLETALPQLIQEDESLCVDAITVCWDLVQGLSSNPLDFWPSLKSFISMVFHCKLLMLTEEQAPNLTTNIKRIAFELMEVSQSKSGVFGLLMQHCCQLWLPIGAQDDSIFASVFSHFHILTEGCVYGPVFRRDQRLIQDVQSYVEQLGEECAANLLCGDNRDDQLPRACALSLLSRLNPSDPQHQRLMQIVVLELLKKDSLISSSKVRYYNNSMQHRVKNRIWQTVLVLFPKLREDFISTLLGSVYQAGFCSNQASVKHLIEWLMILILNKYPDHINSFWECFNVDHEKTKVSICTFLSVLVHFNVILPNIKDQVIQLQKALNTILQCCFNHNFSVRLYALLALKRVWSLAEAIAVNAEGEDGLHSLSSVITSCLNQAEAMQGTGNANKNWIKIQEHFFFGAFHPLRDYSFETLLYTFPSLSELSDDEWIPVWKFEKMLCYSHSPICPLRNSASELRELNPGDWIQQDKSERDKEERWAEVQKKITPWNLDIHEQEPELQLVPQQRAARVGKTHGALLVVASLIDKPTNLGGLCRTCEIFGAGALVLDSLCHVKDKQFQSLSVTSERWLPLLEVKPVELTDFLQLKKNEGYCIVGVEQTANSHSLENYHFPEKTLLLLGNEREGIPANLLQMLDVCVEIPQQGVIRSLNVHVSAALLIWEYTRQHLISGAEASLKVK
ncbi:hypothetical protein WMY93_018928 [Mugilogobius chulae]|uniref:tRNA (guanosine(18)-2'-O)-methyltransferase TARBP1 n=1 Tax=Mugilogobius chulae TaxID=88201 RepID=A0AAW0NRR9_9GOBI